MLLIQDVCKTSSFFMDKTKEIVDQILILSRKWKLMCICVVCVCAVLV